MLRALSYTTTSSARPSRANSRREKTAALKSRHTLYLAEKDKRDDQSVDSNSFGESQCNEHIHLNKRRRLRIAPDCAKSLTASDADANARANCSQTDCQSYADNANIATHNGTSLKGPTANCCY